MEPDNENRKWLLLKINKYLVLCVMMCIIIMTIISSASWLNHKIKVYGHQLDMAQKAHIQHELHPAKKILHDSNVSKSFTPNDDFNTSNQMTDNQNIDRQIKIWLTSIKNRHAYHITTQTILPTTTTSNQLELVGSAVMMTPHTSTTQLTKIVTLTLK